MATKSLEKVDREMEKQRKEELLWIMRLLLSQFSSVNGLIEAVMLSEGNPFLFALENAPKILGRWYLYKKLNKWVKTEESLMKTLSEGYNVVKDTSPLYKLVKMIPPEEFLGVDPKTMKLLKFFDVDITKFEEWRKKHF